MSNLSNYVFGKVQPQALELEQAVLGALMIDKDAISVAAELINARDFYDPRHQSIFKAMIQLYQKSFPVDLLTVNEQLVKNKDSKKCGGAAYLTELTSRVGSSANIEYHIRIIQQKAIARKMISLGSNMIKMAYEEATDIFDLVDMAEQGVFSMTNQRGGNISSMPELALSSVKQMHEAQKSKDGLTGVPSGFVDLDRFTGGFQKKKLYIVAGRPGMGKTAFVLSIAKNAAEFNRPVLIFSLEMGKEELACRLICSESGVNGEKVTTGSLNKDEQTNFEEAANRLSDLPIYIDEAPGLNPFEIRSRARRMKLQKDIQLIVIDYLQLMSGDGGNREQQVSMISQSLKNIAKELDVPVITVSQLSRAVESRGGVKRPMLCDLRESGAIEQDADWVAFIYRPEYYNILTDENGRDLKGICETIIAKNRGGRLDTIELNFDPKTTSFSDFDSSKQFPVTHSISQQNGDLPF